MSPSWSRVSDFDVRFPRVSGDEPSETFRNFIDGLFSPRERG